MRNQIMKPKTRTKWTEEEIKILRENYDKLPYREIEKLLPNHNRTTINRKANMMGLYKVSEYYREAQKNRNKNEFKYAGVTYKKDPVKFFTEETPEKYYVLGFIVGDGNITKSILSIGLQKDDLGHLQKISNTILGENIARIKETHPKDKKNPGKRTLREVAYFCINNKEVVQILNDLGIHENKTFTVDPRTIKIPEEYELNFLLGLIDADGCVHNHVGKTNAEGFRNNIQLGIIGNPYVISWCQEIFTKYTGFIQTIAYPPAYKENKKICTIKITNLRCEEFLKIVYEKNPNLYLDRKRDLYMNFMKWKYFTHKYMKSPRTYTRHVKAKNQVW